MVKPTSNKLNEDLIRKRAEHNDSILPDLEEIALHQQELEKIEALEQCCRKLKILLLQHNVIAKMENLSKLKDLEYLNLALNNITIIEGLEGCEALKKLDMSVNFVDLEDFETSLWNLRANTQLEDLYLMGNPVDKWTGYRDFVAASLPQLKQLDGKMITRQERLLARQQLKKLRKELEELAEANLRRKFYEKQNNINQPDLEGGVGWNPEIRLQDARELHKQKYDKEYQELERTGTLDKEKREVPGVYNAKGEIRQCNEGKWEFIFDDFSSYEWTTLEMILPKHLETPLIDVDINPHYVRVVVKDKLTQLKLIDEVSIEGSNVKRSKTTGILHINMKVLNPNKHRALLNPDLQKNKNEQDDIKPLEKDKLNPIDKDAKEQRTVVAGLGDKLTGAVSLNIVDDKRRDLDKEAAIRENMEGREKKKQDKIAEMKQKAKEAAKTAELHGIPPLEEC